MSVLQSKRTESTLSVILKADELCVWTLKICSNEKHFPKRYRWCITQRIVNDTLDLCSTLHSANNIKVMSREDWLTRKRLQEMAVEIVSIISVNISLAHKLFNLQTSTIEHWTLLISDIIRVLNMWRRSDNKRYSDYNVT